MRFINRDKELDVLEKEYRRKGSSFVVIYGRRRVGKTTLIKEFVKNKKSIYFLADRQKENVQIDRLKEIAAEKFADDVLKDITFDSWDSLLRYIDKNLEIDEKWILVIDEFQYLVKANDALPSILQRLWDEVLKERNIMLILCGSLISMMYDSTLSYKSPLYGRRTSQLKLAPLRFKELPAFFLGKTAVELVELYSFLSGVPKYIEIFEESGDVFSAIEKNILDKDSFLYHEPAYILNEELSEITTYFSLMEIISRGEHKIGKIANKMQIPANHLTSFLNRLIELELLEREVPVTDENPLKSRQGLYFIKDHFFRFWFSYVLPYKSYIEIGAGAFVLKKIKQDFNLFVSQAFERVCRELLLSHPPVEIRKIGRWWDKNEEIDIVALSENEMLVGECKWWEEKVGINILKDLQRKAEFIRKEKQDLVFVLFAKSGFTPDLERSAREDKKILLYDFSSDKIKNFDTFNGREK
jgi:AAA+ ATPase superfamily predicted ATPase